jgi:prophage regulatory protein
MPAKVKRDEVSVHHEQIDRIMSIIEVTRLTSMSQATVFRSVKRGDFPRPFKLSLNRVGWKASAIEKWISTRRPTGARA